MMKSGRMSCVGLLAIAIALATAGCSADEPPASSATPRPASPAIAESAQPMAVQFTPPPPAYNGELPPLPVSAFAPARPPEVIRAVYTFAARHPEVLHYVPCFCGCERSGHKDNDDCFIRSRDTNGRPTWEEHGMT